ncbi:DUF4197 domain-containing protein [Frateuria sp. MAH-13]|uniref:DUF4197 domain-containing protein n=1 Tax=Frateuria flava TaxID=2821489 RepID=A0ABS4DKP5_9GAMM|nr:DUF4197 domain-containing protein [Frateuria flava]MBP1473618.1 DUF4197 domain-containing protein [Frateuria flava]
MRPQTACLGFLLAIAALPAAAGGQFDDLLKQLKQGSHATNTTRAANLPSSDIAAGLKEALAKGTTHAINELGRTDGFWGNAKVRIPLPGKLKQVGDLARQLGQGDKVDAFELSMNRAAEKAVPQVADIFGDAIRKMTLQDARGILTGGDHAATDFFRRVAGDALTARIHPIVAEATDRVGVTQKYKALTAAGGGSGLGNVLGALGNGGDKRNPLDLDDYVTEQTLDGLFTMIGEQEQAIRKNPAARTTDLLKKVFGSR